MVTQLIDIRLAVVAAVPAVGAEYGLLDAIALLGRAAAAFGTVLLSRQQRRGAAARHRAAAQAAAAEELRALVDEPGRVVRPMPGR